MVRDTGRSEEAYKEIRKTVKRGIFKNERANWLVGIRQVNGA